MADLNSSADVFANSSAETVTENMDYLSNSDDPPIDYSTKSTEIFPKPSCFVSPINGTIATINTMDNSFNISTIANEFVSEATNAPIRLYCPFCPLDYGFEYLLKDHIKLVHPLALNDVVRSHSGAIKFQPCPFCHAKFYVKELLTKHVVRKHQGSVISMFTEMSPKNYIQCRFCAHKVLSKHEKLLMVHIEKKHYDEFEKYIRSKYSNIIMSPEDLGRFDCKAKQSDQIITPGLSDIMKKLSTDEEVQFIKKPVIIKPILKVTGSCSPDMLSDEGKIVIEGNEINTSASNSIKGKVRRKLRFNLPDLPSEKENNPVQSVCKKKKNYLSQPERNVSKWRLLFGSRKKGNHLKKQREPVSSSPVPLIPEPKQVNMKGKVNKKMLPVFSKIGFSGTGSSQQFKAVMRFKCGLCLEGFDNNATLLEHLKKSHPGLQLQAQYRCGECHAKFYRNSFLVRHCWFHHTPRCLRVKQERNT